MTIIPGEPFRIETIEQFKNQLNVDGEEILKSASKEEQQSVIARYNEICEEWDEEPVETIDELPDHIYEKWHAYYFEDSITIIPDVLDARDTAYIHLYYAPLHYIVECPRVEISENY